MEQKPKKNTKRRMFSILINIVIVVLIIVGIIQSGIIGEYLGQKKYEDLSESVKVEYATPSETIEYKEPKTIEETEAAYESPIDFEALEQRNSDTVGWVTIANTNIDYPIVWNGDNEFYLHHDIDKKTSVNGAIYLDADDKPDFSSLNVITYGHHMKNKSMYENIVLFKDEKFFNENRDVYIYTKERMYHLKTMACLYTDADGEKRRTLFSNKEDFDTYIDKMTKDCSFRELPETGIKQLWTFVTCSYEFDDARTILYCYEVDDDGNPVEPDESLYYNQQSETKN